MDSDATGWLSARQEAALTPDEIVLQAKSMCDHFGFTSIKLKAERYPDISSMHVRTVRNIRKNVSRIDPNAVWSVETSVKYGKQMEGIEYYEDPTRGQKAMSEVAKQVSIPLATNSTTSFDDLPAVFNWVRNQ